jgi:hypothetical protein
MIVNQVNSGFHGQPFRSFAGDGAEGRLVTPAASTAVVAR